MAKRNDGDIERRLCADAEQIRADVPPELRARIQASLHAARQVRSVPVARRKHTGYWWASGLTGIATALLVMLLINWNRNAVIAVPEEQVATTVTPEIVETLGYLPLKARTADFTGPLEEELQNLQSDLEKARLSVERDLRSTL